MIGRTQLAQRINAFCTKLASRDLSYAVSARRLSRRARLGDPLLRKRRIELHDRVADIYPIPIYFSLGVIVGVLAIAVITSVTIGKKAGDPRKQ